MIKIDLTNTIKTEIEQKHWEYFKTNFLQEFRDITNKETNVFLKSVFSFLLDDENGNERLKNKLVLGTNENHRSIITHVERLISHQLAYDFNLWENKLNKTKDKIPKFSYFNRPNIPNHINELRDAGEYIQEIKDIFDASGFIKTAAEAKEIGRNIRAKYNELCEEHKEKEKSYQSIISKLKVELEKVFDYDAFSKSKNVWGAYILVQKLNVHTCPYCNRSFTTTFFSEDGKTRPPLDHFIPKAKYPYLALSLYNLIPCCQICNSSFKGIKDFYMTEHLHPYQEYFGNDAKFITDLKPDKDGNYALTLLSGATPTNNFELKLKIKHSSPIKSKIENSITTFHIEELYQFHKDYVLEIIRKSVFYNSSKIDELLNDEIFGGLFESREELIQTIIGNYIEEQHLSKRVLSKLTKDIWEEYGLRDIWRL
jgi:hypothetical protein